MTRGSTVRNDGSIGRASAGFAWGESLTIVRRDSHSYGTDRYVVRNAAGRHGYLYF
ncbi:hypothetical protein SHEEN_86 [Mycobacterium phage Sheen]|uniref:Uncharacterized protein n=1 Tax=Mycobacterium phage Sheen TaxID=1589274 RepID=A0A0B5A3P0_9CAUD|nr:hypothetical protein AVV31_gp08 [Mycobacterium phage Sheen]AJD82504.1 hypothetical protein SHEEN_86 [Mycobacterium phage Sheen]